MKTKAAFLLALFGALLGTLLGNLLLSTAAFAHAAYLRSEPGSGAVVAESPPRVDIWFTQELFRRQGENQIAVVGPAGQPVQAGEAQIDDDDRSHLWVSLQASLPPGEYRVDWRSLSAEDGDAEEGSFTFVIDPQAAATSTPMGMPSTPAATNPPGTAGQPPTASGTPLSTPAAPQSTAGSACSQSGRGSCLAGLVPAAGLASTAWRLGFRKAGRR
jgi:methionine-rich copper-binding protein CopC